MYTYLYAATQAPLRCCLPIDASAHMIDLYPYRCGAGIPRSVLNRAAALQGLAKPY